MRSLCFCLFVCARLFVCVFVCLFVRSFVRLFVRSFVCSLIPSLLRSFVRSFVRSFARLFVCLFVCLLACSVSVSLLLFAVVPFLSLFGQLLRPSLYFDVFFVASVLPSCRFAWPQIWQEWASEASSWHLDGLAPDMARMGPGHHLPNSGTDAQRRGVAHELLDALQ